MPLSAVISVALATAAPAAEAFGQQGSPLTSRGGKHSLGVFDSSVGGLQATKLTACKSSDLKPGRFRHLVAEHTSCSDARKTARAWHGNLACAGNTCTANGYRCKLAFFMASGGSPASHQTCTRGPRRVRFDWIEH